MIKTKSNYEDIETSENEEEQTLQNPMSLLPELMNRNLILGCSLNKKLKVNSFLNNTELRNQCYLKKLINNSDKKLKDIKFGLDIKKAIKKSTEDLTIIKNQILNDLLIKKSNIIIKTSKEIKLKDSEKETNLKINNLLYEINKCVNPEYHPISKIKIIEGKKYKL